ncbi:hypothetical protein K501DRAFT_248401 [Backusella circina FSU 941]|nr:hypothetical protein K501DRAFT_248401 [Backusella circina FSU 941]
MSESETVNKRIYIGGLHPSTTEDSIKERFSKFGQIGQVTVAKDTEGQCRGFAHMAIETTPKQWTSCISVYNNSKWKGNILKLEDAKPDYQECKRVADEKLRERQEKRQKILLRWNQSDGFHSRDMKPVTDNNLRKGWKRGRYGRAIAVMRLKRPNGSTIVFEPTHYKNNLTKLYNIDASMKPVKRLAAFYDDYKDSDDEDDWPSLSKYQQQQQDDVEMEETLEDDNNKPQTDDEKRRQAIEKRLQEQEARKEMIRKSLADKSNEHTTFSDDDDKVDDAFLNDEQQQKVDQAEPKDGNKWMFDDSDEEEEGDDVEIKINPVLEGEAGRKRLELQSKFKGDERFKLGEDFIDQDEEDKKESGPVGDEISQSLGAEKDQAMDVLRAMFGEVTPKPKPTNTQQQWSGGAQWSTGARFDPDEEESSKYLVSKPQEEEEEEKEEEVNDKGDDDADFFDQPRKPESAMPEVSTDKHFEINVNLKPLFGAGEDAPFSLFGGNNDNESTSAAPSLFSTAFKQDDNDNDEYDSINFAPKKKEGKLGLGVMFFFHMDQPSLMKKSCYSYDAQGVFQMKQDEKESYEEEWRKQRLQIKEVLKKRQKSAVRIQKKRAGN